MTCIHGDVRDALPTLPDGCAQTCVTSPPYWGLRDYGVAGQIGLEATPDEYVATMVAVFREVRRVLADDGVLWLNLGDSYAPSGLKPKDLCGIPWRVAFALQAEGWYLRQDIIWAKPNPMPESVTDRCTEAHEYLFMLTKAARYYYDADAIAENSVDAPGKSRGGSLSRIGCDDFVSANAHRGAPVSSNGRANRRSVWTIPSAPYPDAHFATFPPALIEPCILAGSRPGDVVLDPFMGSGTTAQVAQALNRRWLGVELNPDYHDMQARRTAQASLPLACP